MKTLEERFWEKVEKGKSCWIWRAAKDESGYGKIGVSGKVEMAHRVSWSFENGEIPNGMCVLHRCDNPSCVRASHLFIGDQKENMNDMTCKGRRSCGDSHSAAVKHGIPRGDAHYSRNGRSMKGDKHPNSKLTSADVIDIRSRVSFGEKRSVLANEYGISYTHLCAIASGAKWRHI